MQEKIGEMPQEEPGQGGPERKFRAGAISATVWKNERLKQNGESFTAHTVSLERSYKDKSGQWKSTSSFRPQDLPKARLVIDEAFKFISLGGEMNE